MSNISDQNNGWDSLGSWNTSRFSPRSGACFSWTFYIDTGTQIPDANNLLHQEFFFQFSDDEEEDGFDHYYNHYVEDADTHYHHNVSPQGSYVNSEAHASSFPPQEFEEDNEEEDGSEHSDLRYDPDDSIAIIVHHGADVDEEGSREAQPEGVGDASETVPATKESIERLGMVSIEDPSLVCAICMEDLHIGSDAKRMPCLHVYHGSCIDQWLVIKSNCPLCRSRMTTGCN